MTAAKRLWVPCYSHAGETEPGWPRVSGLVTGSGRPIQVGGSHPSPSLWPAFFIINKSATSTVILEANGGVLDANGNPPEDEWVDVSNGGYSMTSGTVLCKRVNPAMPYYRTRITVSGPGDVHSYVPLLILPDGRSVSAGHPHKIG